MNINIYNETIISKKYKKNSAKIFWLLFIISTIIASLLIVCIGFLYYLNKQLEIKVTNTISYIPTRLKPLENQKCKSDSSYNNRIKITKNIAAYTRDAFYKNNWAELKEISTLLPEDVLYIESIKWDDLPKDGLKYTGSALVCVREWNKLAAIQFSTEDTSFENIVRYNDPDFAAKNILIQAIYMIPNDVVEKQNWHESIEKNIINIQKAHLRLFKGQSTIEYTIYPEVVKTNFTKDFLSITAQEIVGKDTNNQELQKPISILEKGVYTPDNNKSNMFITKEMQDKYDIITTLVYFDVGAESLYAQKSFESGYAYLFPALNNGNYFGIIGINFNKDISLNSAPYHEFMHTLGLYDEYKYSDESIQRIPTRLYNGQKQEIPSLMEEPGKLDLTKTYIDDQIRIKMGLEL